jgi:hypothetical protein
MPFSKTTEDHTEEYWNTHFKDYLKPLLEEVPNVVVKRSQPLRGDIVREIIKDLILSPVVVANLTDSNANVYWELGVRQSFRSGTVTISDDSYKSRIPFDIGAKSILFYYPNDTRKDTYFRADLKKAVQDCLDHPGRPDSSVLESISGRGTLFEIVHREESTRRLDGLLWELDRNEKIWRAIMETVHENKEKPPGQFDTVTDRFRLTAVEHLLTDRYVDQPKTVFVDAELYHRDLVAINDQLNMWSADYESTQDWFLKERADVEKHSKEFREDVQHAHQILRARF